MDKSILGVVMNLVSVGVGRIPIEIQYFGHLRELYLKNHWNRLLNKSVQGQITPVLLMTKVDFLPVEEGIKDS